MTRLTGSFAPLRGHWWTICNCKTNNKFGWCLIIGSLLWSGYCWVSFQSLLYYVIWWLHPSGRNTKKLTQIPKLRAEKKKNHLCPSLGIQLNVSDSRWWSKSVSNETFEFVIIFCSEAWNLRQSRRTIFSVLVVFSFLNFTLRTLICNHLCL